MIKILGVLLLVLFLSACGFHLRGMSDMPSWLSQVAIISKDNDMEFYSRLKSSFESNHIEVCPEPNEAPFWLLINAIQYQKQIVSIGSSTNPRQYQLIMTINYCLQNDKGESILPQAHALVTRQLTVNNDRILGSNAEELILMNEMRQNAVNQIINRLSLIEPNAN